MIDRRGFLSLGAGATLTAAGLVKSSKAYSAPRIVRYIRLGRTGFKISDISFGSASSADPDLVRHARHLGINYFDTAESYRWGAAEDAIGEALQSTRHEVYIASKAKSGASDTRTDMMKALEDSLKRLRTDYVDIYFNHAVNDVARMQNQEWWEFTELAKRQGKIRFRGMSGHGERLKECLEYAIEEDLVDVILIAHSFAQDPSFTDKVRHTFHWAAIQPDLTPVLKQARKKDVGVIAMKTLMGARMNDMRPYERNGGTFSQAAFRWVLSNPQVDALIVSMTSKESMDEFVMASGATRTTEYDRNLLARYADLRAGNYCAPGCNRCEESCPKTVPIADVMRSRMYAVDYGDPLLAKQEYASLGAGVDACVRCQSLQCMGACPAGVPIAQFARYAAHTLG